MVHVSGSVGAHRAGAGSCEGIKVLERPWGLWSSSGIWHTGVYNRGMY